MGDPGAPEGQQLLPPTLAAAFEAGEVLGRGSFATVVAARDRALDRPVAIKLLHRKDTESRRRFLREAAVMAELSTPHVVRVFDSGEADGSPYLVMERIEGKVLDPLAFAGDARRLVADVAEGLARIHEAGLVHRDVKPQNVMVSRDGRAVLLDLGLVRGRGDRTRLTRDGMVIGSLRYLSPEGMRGERATPAADWYALGTVAFELLEARPPYTDAQVMARMEGEEPPPLRFHRLDPEGPEAELLAALLDPDPARRRVSPELYQAVLSREAPASLRRAPSVPTPVARPRLAAASAPTPSADDSQAQPRPKGDRRFLLLGLFGLGVLGASLASWTHGRAEPAPPPAPREVPGKEEREAVRDALRRLAEGHRAEDGTLHEALRGQGYDHHLKEVAAEYVDPRLPVRWQRLTDRLAAYERAAGGSAEARRAFEEVLLEEVMPVLRHLSRDRGMLVVVRMGSSMPGAVLPDTLTHLSPEETASIRARMDEIGERAYRLISTLEALRVPRSDELAAVRGEFLSQADDVTLSAELVELQRRARDPNVDPGDRAHLYRAMLGALPSGFRMTTAPCGLRREILSEAVEVFTAGEGPDPAERAEGLAAAIHAWFGTMGDCHRASPEAMLPELERLVGRLEETWRADPAGVVQQLRWAQLIEGGLMLYGYHSRATDPFVERFEAILMDAAAIDDPTWAAEQRARKAGR